MERFGYYVRDDDFEKGLRWLLTDGRWQTLGEAGAEFVQGIFREKNSIDLHLAHYWRLVQGARVPLRDGRVKGDVLCD